MQNKTFDRAARAYVDAHFATLAAVATAAGCSTEKVLDLAVAGIAPGAVYARDPERGWWSALGGWVDGGPGAPGEEATIWLSPWAIWSFRRALLAEREGEAADAVAAGMAGGFRDAFRAALAAIDAASAAYPACFDVDGRVDPTAAAAQADVEWESWLGGGYAVCLKTFSGYTCVEKESLGALLKRHAADPGTWPMRARDALEACATLAGLMLPFAPWERPTGTPGRTIDTLLARHGLGREAPYG